MRKIVEHLKQADPVMRRIVEAVGPYRMEYMSPEFSTLVRSIAFQQISGNVARVIYGRLETALERTGVTPEAILKLRPQRMRRFGLSTQKTAYIRDLARCTRDGSVRFEDLPAMDDEAVIECLTQVKGIGRWTAQMFLMFALRRKDVLAPADLGVQTAIRKAWAMEELPKPAVVEAMGEKWRPHRTAACWYLWRSLDGMAGL